MTPALLDMEAFNTLSCSMSSSTFIHCGKKGHFEATTIGACLTSLTRSISICARLSFSHRWCMWQDFLGLRQKLVSLLKSSFCTG